MEIITLNGIILKETPVKENDKILTVATDALGKISVFCKGARKVGSHLSLGMGTMSLLSMELKRSSGDMYILTGVEKAVDFSTVTKDLESFAYLGYIFQLSCDLFLEEEPFPELFKLLLNTIYLYSVGKKNKELIKCTFELRAMFISGYAFAVDECENCGSESDLEYLDLYNGGIYCRECGKSIESTPIDGEMLKVLRHITYAEDKNLFAFRLPDGMIKKLSVISTNYIKICMEKRYSSLEYLRKLQKSMK